VRSHVRLLKEFEGMSRVRVAVLAGIPLPCLEAVMSRYPLTMSADNAERILSVGTKVRPLREE
jgi:hypothetical protein